MHMCKGPRSSSAGGQSPGDHSLWVLDLINFGDEKLGQITNRCSGNEPALVPLSREGLGRATQIKHNENFFSCRVNTERE